MKQFEFEFIEICEIFKSVTHTRRMESSAKSVLWEGCLTLKSFNSERKSERTAQII